jgi:hypothetical protein
MPLPMSSPCRRIAMISLPPFMFFFFISTILNQFCSLFIQRILSRKWRSISQFYIRISNLPYSYWGGLVIINISNDSIYLTYNYNKILDQSLFL